MAGFKTQWTTSAPGETITLPLTNNGTFNCTVNWGDGGATSTITAWDDVDKTHTYAAAGTYDVEITGECPGWSFNNGGDKLKIVDILYWGDSADFGGFQYLTGGFYGCTNLKSTGVGKILVKVGLADLAYLFSNCSNASFTSITSGLFDNCVNLTSCVHVFSGCNKITTAPSGLLDNCVNLTGVNAFFYLCTLLETIPANFFKGSLIVSFRDALSMCSKLQLNKNIFYADGEQATRFKNKNTDFTRCFSRTSFTGIQGEAPDLWNCDFGTGTIITTDCFAGAGNTLTSISNYESIPNAWGGVLKSVAASTGTYEWHQKKSATGLIDVVLSSAATPVADGWMIRSLANGSITVSPRFGAAIITGAASTIKTDTWHKITFERSVAGLMKLYVDGVLVGSATATTFPVANYLAADLDTDCELALCDPTGSISLRKHLTT
jgi:hypothetical protein